MKNIHFEYDNAVCNLLGITTLQTDNNKRANIKCCYCEKYLNNKNRTKEHIVAKSKGGRIILLCCDKCNNEKGNLSINQYEFKIKHSVDSKKEIKLKNIQLIKKRYGKYINSLESMYKNNKAPE